MNRERCKELLPIIQAFAEGKEVQIKMRNGEWETWDTYSFDDIEKYRIKPEPAEFWTVIYSDGQSMSMGRSKEGAKSHLKDLQNAHPGQFEDAYVAKVREVIE